jgi:isopenicillin-N N-acyltransferase-like protein
VTESYPQFAASGNHRELGLQHGAQAGERINRFLEYQARLLKISRDTLRARALKWLPLWERYCPHLLEELGGLAEGAGLPLADALASQLRGELGHVESSGCTSLAIGPRGTASGDVLIGQTSDMAPDLVQFGYVLQLSPEDKPDVLMWTFGGMIGYHGINEHGVAHFANSLSGGPGWKFVLSHYPLKRMILEQRTVDDVVQLMRDVPVCSNGNYVLCDGTGAVLDVELTSEGPELIRDNGAGFVAHANHYLCAAHACERNFEQSLPDSFSRQKRIEELVRGRFGAITPDDVKGFFADHQGHPTSICRHPHDGADHPMLAHTDHTVAALVAEPAAGRLHVACGNPCENEYHTHTLAAGAG